MTFTHQYHSFTTAVGQETHTLNLESPLKNPYGIFAFRTKHANIPTAMEQFADTVDVFINIQDYHDFLAFEADIYQAKLSEDGSSLSLFVPCHPTWMLRMQAIDAIHTMPCRLERDSTSKTRDAHVVVMSRAKFQEKKIHVNELVLKFPPGIKCNNKWFNKVTNEKDTISLLRDIAVVKMRRTFEDRGRVTTLERQYECVAFKMAITGSEDNTQMEESPPSQRNNAGFAAMYGSVTVDGSKRYAGAPDPPIGSPYNNPFATEAQKAAQYAAHKHRQAMRASAGQSFAGYAQPGAQQPTPFSNAANPFASPPQANGTFASPPQANAFGVHSFSTPQQANAFAATFASQQTNAFQQQTNLYGSTNSMPTQQGAVFGSNSMPTQQGNVFAPNNMQQQQQQQQQPMQTAWRRQPQHHHR